MLMSQTEGLAGHTFVYILGRGRKSDITMGDFYPAISLHYTLIIQCCFTIYSMLMFCRYLVVQASIMETFLWAYKSASINEINFDNPK